MDFGGTSHRQSQLANGLEFLSSIVALYNNDGRVEIDVDQLWETRYASTAF